MLARDWYYNERRQIGLNSAVASICELHDDRDVRARAALTMLGVQRGWRIADIGCGNGVLACEAAMLGAEVDAIDISPAMLALAQIQARDRKVAIRTQPAGLLSFAYQPDFYDLVVSEFTLHHLPDFWKAVALSRIRGALKPGACFFLRDIVFVSGAVRSVLGGSCVRSLRPPSTTAIDAQCAPHGPYAKVFSLRPRRCLQAAYYRCPPHRLGRGRQPGSSIGNARSNSSGCMDADLSFAANAESRRDAWPAYQARSAR